MDFLSLAKEKMQLVELDPAFGSRSVNEGFSGGEKKRNEVFQMAVLEPRLAILDEIDSGLDIDALRIVARGVNALRRAGPRASSSSPTTSGSSSTSGRIGCTSWRAGGSSAPGGPELADELEQTGYAWVAGAARERRRRGSAIVNAAETSLLASFAPAGARARLARRRARRRPRALPGARAADRAPRGLALHEPRRARRGVVRARAPRATRRAPRRSSPRAPAPAGPRLVFVNGRLDPALSTRGALPQGAILSSLADALRERPGPGPAATSAASPAPTRTPSSPPTRRCSRTAGSSCSRAASALDAPLALVFVTDASAGPVAVHPRTLVVAERGRARDGRGGLPRPRRLPHERGHRARPRRRRVGRARARSRSSRRTRSTSAASTPSRAPSRASPPTRSRSARGCRARRSGRGSAARARRSPRTASTWRTARASPTTSRGSSTTVPRCTTTESYKGILDGSARGVFAGPDPGAAGRAEDRRATSARPACSSPTTRSSTRSRSSRSSRTT